MKSKTSQRTVYVVTAVIVASMISGFALATLSLGGTANSYQGSQTTTVTPLPGLTWEFTALSQVNVSTVLTTGCGGTASTPCNVYSTPAMVCAGNYPGAVTPCGSGDFIEQVNLTTILGVPFFGGTYPSTVGLTVAVTGTPFGDVGVATYVGHTIWLTETVAGTNAAENVALLFDVGSMPNGPGAVTSVSVLATTS